MNTSLTTNRALRRIAAGYQEQAARAIGLVCGIALCAATAMAQTQVLQYGFDFTSGTVDSQGTGTVADDTVNVNDGLLSAPGRGNGGTYTADIPTAGTMIGEAQNVTGIGSLNIDGSHALSTGTGVFSGEALNGLSAAQVGSAGGITYELWVKGVSNVSDGGHLLVLGGMHGIAVDASTGLGFIYGDTSATLAPATPIDTMGWTHIAVTMATADSAAMAFTNISLYANGVKVAEDADGHTFPWFLDRGAGVGKHGVFDGDEADGLVYEPRISAGVLAPSDFTVVSPSPGLSAPDAVSDATNGGTISLVVPVGNTAGVAYDVTGISFSGPAASDFGDDGNTFPLTIPAGGSEEISIDFTPSAGGLAEATLTLATNDPNHATIDVALSVEVRDPEIEIDSSLDFGSFAIPPGPTTGDITVQNFGETVSLTLSNPQITGAGAAAFSVTSLPGSIVDGGFDVVEITFDPVGEDSYAAQLSLETNDPFTPTVTVDLSGSVVGGGVPVLQYGFDFTSGTVSDNGGSVADDTSNGNTGLLDAPGRNNGGTYSGDIPTSGTAQGEAQNVTGIGSLDVTGGDALSTGTGAFSGEALAGLTGADVDAVGGITYELWVKNVNNVSDNGQLLVLGGMHGIAVHPTDGVGFLYGDNGAFLTPDTPVDTSDWTHIAVTMAATAGQGGTQYDRITLYVNGWKVAEDADGHTFPWFLDRAAGVGKHGVFDGDEADGLVYEPRISVGTLAPTDFTVVPPPPGIFAPTMVADSSDGLSLQVTIPVDNTDTSVRNLSASSFSGPDAGDFLDSTVPATIAGGTSEDLILDFTPSRGGGTYMVTVTINSDDPNRPAYKVEVTIEVLDPAIVIDSALGFGALAGPGTDTQPVFIDNYGATADLTLSNPQITGAGASVYSVTSLPGAIGPGGFGQIEVTFNLGAVGTFPAKLKLDTNDPFNPTVTVDLTGEVTEILGGIKINSVGLVSPTRMRIDFTGAASTLHQLKSSPDLQTNPFTDAVTVVVDGLTTDGTGAGFVEFDITVPGKLFYQIQVP